MPHDLSHDSLGFLRELDMWAVILMNRERLKDECMENLLWRLCLRGWRELLSLRKLFSNEDIY